MKRMQVLLEPETLKKVKSVSKRKNISASNYIRDAVKKELNKEQKEKKNAANVLLKRAKNAFPGGPEDLSQNDDYLYDL